MKRLANIAGGLLGLLALGALVAALALTFGGLPREAKPAPQVLQSPIQTPTQPPYPPPATPTPGPPATPTPTSIPGCTFAGRTAPIEPATPLEAYRFSEPRVVMTHTSAIGIAGWLPDGQRLLVTRLIPGQSREYVEVFNTRTGELQRYGERHSLPGKPVWGAAHQAVAFADVSPDKQLVLRISRGEGASVETPVSGLAGSFLGVSPDGRQVVFFTQASPGRPEVLDLAQPRQVPLPVALPLTQWPPYRVSWHPQGQQMAFYNQRGFYLADLPSGQVCELDLGFEESEARYGKRWALYAQWSPNGRYLAMLTTVGNLPVKFSDLTVLDATTGELYSIHPEQYINPGQYYVMDMAWAPNSQLIVIRVAVEMREGVMYEGLYLVEVASGRYIRMLPEALFTGGDVGWNLAWSSNSQQIATSCPTANEGRLCIIAVTTR